MLVAHRFINYAHKDGAVRSSSTADQNIYEAVNRVRTFFGVSERLNWITDLEPIVSLTTVGQARKCLHITSGNKRAHSYNRNVDHFRLLHSPVQLRPNGFAKVFTRPKREIWNLG